MKVSEQFVKFLKFVLNRCFKGLLTLQPCSHGPGYNLASS